MKLLAENELIWSWVVANSKMNRERNASGVNSYEKELKFRPEEFLEKHIQQYGQVKWLDLCCGQGKALIQTGEWLLSKGLQDKATLKGIDLVDAFQTISRDITCVDFEVRSLVDWSSIVQFDLITCVRGLHYIGDKIKVLASVFERLTPEGVFIANLDLSNIQIENIDTEDYLLHCFKKHDVQYNRRTRIWNVKALGRLISHLSIKGPMMKWGLTIPGRMRCVRCMG
ncbi:MAG: methyltransferase domain-containing protein [Niastella sp.]|uniref:methyltransferase domain-containing protein n=1 Tax=Niastella sp. TaxID=1869183 RepID=UPI00389A2376